MSQMWLSKICEVILWLKRRIKRKNTILDIVLIETVTVAREGKRVMQMKISLSDIALIFIAVVFIIGWIRSRGKWLYAYDKTRKVC